MKPPLLLALLAAVLACPSGTNVRKFAPARSPNGIQADLRVGKQQTRIMGELLEVRDTSLLVLRDGARVTSIPIRQIRSGSFARLGTLIASGRVSGGDREQLRLVSRFPGGLGPEIAAQLLGAYGQTEPDRAVP
jgi:hypothetical protein